MHLLSISYYFPRDKAYVIIVGMSERQKQIYESMDAVASNLPPLQREEFAWLVTELTSLRGEIANHHAVQRWLKANGYTS